MARHSISTFHTPSQGVVEAPKRQIEVPASILWPSVLSFSRQRVMKKLPQPKTCCNNVSLRTGVILICLADIAASAYLIVAVSVGFTHLQKYDAIEVPSLIKWKSEASRNASDIISVPIKRGRASQMYPALVYALMAYLIINVFFNILYLVGVKKDSACYMMPSLVAHVLGILFYTIENCIFAFTASMEALELIGWLIGEVVAIYFFLVLNSYYQQLSQGFLQPETIVLPPGILAMVSKGQKMTESSSIISLQQTQLPQYQSVVTPINHTPPAPNTTPTSQ